MRERWRQVDHTHQAATLPVPLVADLDSRSCQDEARHICEIFRLGRGNLRPVQRATPWTRRLAVDGWSPPIAPVERQDDVTILGAPLADDLSVLELESQGNRPLAGARVTPIQQGVDNCFLNLPIFFRGDDPHGLTALEVDVDFRAAISLGVGDA